VELENRLDALLSLAEQLGIRVRREPLGGEGGGLCTLRGERFIFLDTSADLETRYERTLSALAGLSELERLYIVPEIREDIEGARRGRRG
jgi:hypothetical protein